MKCTDRVIFRSRVLDKEIDPTSLRPTFANYNAAHVAYVQRYLAYRIPFDTDPRQLGFRVQQVAKRVCELTGDDDVTSCIHRLCGLYFWDSPTFATNDLIRNILCKETTEEQFRLDLVSAAVYMSLPILAGSLHSEQDGVFVTHCQSVKRPHSWNRDKHVRWLRYEIAAYHGDKSMIEVLLATDPTKASKIGRPIPLDYLIAIIQYSPIHGHWGVYNFALDYIQPYDLSQIYSTMDYEDLTSAVNTIGCPIVYRRLASIYGSHRDDEIFSRNGKGDVNLRLCESAVRGHVDMVRYYLDLGATLNDLRAKGLQLKEIRKYNMGVLITPRIVNPLLSVLWNCSMGCEAVVKLLLESGADPNWGSSEETALMMAIQKHRLVLVQLLVEYGASLVDGKVSPAALARGLEDDGIRQYLMEKEQD